MAHDVVGRRVVLRVRVEREDVVLGRPAQGFSRYRPGQPQAQAGEQGKLQRELFDRQRIHESSQGGHWDVANQEVKPNRAEKV